MRRFQILVCDGPSCGITHESDRLVTLLKAGIAADQELKARCHVVAYNCFGRCSEGPNMFVRPLAPNEKGEVEPREVSGPGFYPGVDEEKATRILEQHAGEGTPVAEWVEEY
ncbi:(2Fe-2S) ferredoxin domain-containing protein [Nannocystis punicea]|uniref:(2Fe-2S) ferredoxin domain-containing protein n=1 Tax=Nannocystis punicea TaxID=2995304 RepID=A0ABY7HF38_9BACT|nr:(2Fe-2S) ferredoxin domain-containing protein [Nannocystis poenicansa]WAS97705.1 (2Fe-2S) ferredoxin domain-containing protein [Nannocystis poenicansa]